MLFFIPDIGGFTRFVANTEISHSQHIVKDLLEVLVDGNQLGMQVSEIEGDAVLFARPGAPPPLAELLSQAKRMFVDFHSYLKQFEMQRVCQCGACSSAARISLKFVVHAGPASTMDVKGHTKFIGKSVIVAHRLLKNSVPLAEYLLVTQETLSQLGAIAALPPSLVSSSSYDEIGEVSYRYWSLEDYLSDVRVRPPVLLGLNRPHRVMQMSRIIGAPPAEIYQLLIDLPARMQWIEGITEVDVRDQNLNQIGKVHRCVRGSDDPEMVTSEVKITPSSMEFWETDIKKIGAARYLVEHAPGNSTRLTLEFYVRDNILVRAMFKLLMKRKMTPAIKKSMDNLAALIESERKSAHVPPRGILQASKES